jgi:hypothetical protein
MEFVLAFGLILGFVFGARAIYNIKKELEKIKPDITIISKPEVITPKEPETGANLWSRLYGKK